MIFGRKNRSADVEEVDDELLEAEPADDDDASAGDDDLHDDFDEMDEPDDGDEWAALDASRDWRQDGPFDLSEVDLDADDIERLDFGALILTPFDGMQMQLQVDQQSGLVQAVLVMHQQSAIEIALFAAPAQSSMAAEIRDQMAEATVNAQGTVTLAEGPFGTEIRRVMPIQDEAGQQVDHVSRTWFAEGPKWALRGVLMGEAGMQEGVEGPTEMLFEFFANTVVRRGHDPKVPGVLIPMTIPDSLTPTAESEPKSD